MTMTRPLHVHVLVGLTWRPQAGGHVKCWESFARAALDFPGRIALTVHFMAESSPKKTGDNEQQGKDRSHHYISLGRGVGYRLHRPLVSTAHLSFLSHAPDHTDLAPYHFGLARALAKADVIHTTDAFSSFAATGRRVARARNIPLVNSIHTDNAAYTRQYTAQTVHRLLGQGLLSRVLLGPLAVDQRGERIMRRKLARYQRDSAFALLTCQEDYAAARAVLPPPRIGCLGRGVDTQRFHPRWRDRTWLHRTYGIDSATPVVLFAGRVDAGKRAMVAAKAMERVIESGITACLFCAGDGADRSAIMDRLGRHAVCPGFVAPEDMPRLYASADVFAMPSQIETFGNAAAEALASGLPTLVSEAGQVGRLLRPKNSGFVIRGGVRPWADAVSRLLGDEAQRARMSIAARHTAEEDLPSWGDVIKDQLLPVWHAAAHRHSALPDSLRASSIWADPLQTD